jgi:tetratricopeptide (TPR) repeat protein
VNFSALLVAMVLAAVQTPKAPTQVSLHNELLTPEGQIVEQLFDTWQFSEADRTLDSLAKMASGTPQVLYLQGYQAFLKGDYKVAVAKLGSARQQFAGHRNIEGLWTLAAAADKVIEGHAERRSKHFRVRFPPEDEVLADHALETLESAAAALKADLGFEPSYLVSVDFYRNSEDLAAVSPLSEEEVERTGTIALCKWARLMVTSPRALRLGYPWMDTLSHEFVHYAVSSLTKDQAPVWLQEGLAKFLETRWHLAAGAPLALGNEHLLAKALASNKLITFEAMHPSMAKLPRAEDAALAFAEVATTIAFVFDQGGMTAVKTAVEAVGNGVDARAAVASALSLEWPMFDKKWRAYMKSRNFKTYPHLESIAPKFRKKVALASKRGPTEDEALAELGVGKADGFLRLGNIFLLRNRPKAAAIEFAKGAKLAGPSNWLFPVKLGRTYLALREPDKAIKALGELRRIYQELPWPHLIAGQAWLAKGEAEKAREALEASLANNPFDPELHCALANTYASLANSNSDFVLKRDRARRACDQR